MGLTEPGGPASVPVALRPVRGSGRVGRDIGDRRRFPPPRDPRVGLGAGCVGLFSCQLEVPRGSLAQCLPQALGAREGGQGHVCPGPNMKGGSVFLGWLVEDGRGRNRYRLRSLAPNYVFFLVVRSAGNHFCLSCE